MRKIKKGLWTSNQVLGKRSRDAVLCRLEEKQIIQYNGLIEVLRDPAMEYTACRVLRNEVLEILIYKEDKVDIVMDIESLK